MSHMWANLCLPLGTMAAIPDTQMMFVLFKVTLWTQELAQLVKWLRCKHDPGSHLTQPHNALERL